MLKRLNSSMVCLQETHLSPGQTSPFSTKMFGTQFHSVFSSYSRGVSILVSTSVPFACSTSLVAPHGQYTFLFGTLDGLQCIIMNVYIPPPFSVEVVKLVANFLAHHPNIPALVVGDFNNYLDKYSKRAQPHTMGKGQTPFAGLLLELGLRDVWRLQHPQVKCYSCHSASHGGLSRIDLGLGNETMLPLISSAQYAARTVSNHSSLCIKILKSGVAKRVCWKINQFWLSLFPNPDPIHHNLSTFIHINKPTASPGIF